MAGKARKVRTRAPKKIPGTKTTPRLRSVPRAATRWRLVADGWHEATGRPFSAPERAFVAAVEMLVAARGPDVGVATGNLLVLFVGSVHNVWGARRLLKLLGP
jgi:hypothetical protein